MSANRGLRTIRTMCPMNCHPTLCGMLADVEDGRLVGVRGDPDNPDSRGFLCVRGHASKEIIDNPARLVRPLVRARRTAGQRGGGAWQDASWDDALDLIAARMRAAGREAVGIWSGHGAFANNYGTRVNSHLMRRFANLFGCQWWNPTMICWGLGGFGLGLTGPLETNTKEDMGAHASLVLLWGANVASQPNTAPHLVTARRRGAHFHGFYDHGQALPTLARLDPEPELWISPADGAARGVADGAPIRIYNERGEMRARARVTDRIGAGTVWMRDGWTGLNDLTSGAPALPDDAVDTFGFSGGQATFDAMVDVAAIT